MARESYNEQVHVRSSSPPTLSLALTSNSLTHEQAIGFEKFAYFMRLYIVYAKSLIGNDNMERA
ncbi:hypothetical protein SAY87_013596 [Trapa incisa]|uniref:Uncharacterized protein n=1 Tax=Trapa incisa TaxID=236973 RepID=A0AAN7K8Z0_9MYRT|nr:hypothetical protein SAY87_013596 [Trapa incisa]